MILSLIGIVLAILFYFKSRRKKSIMYYFKSDLLIQDFIQKIKGLTIKFFEKNINELTVTKIVFWNNGTETINANDIPTNDKFSIIIANDYDILDVSIINIINITNDINFFISENGKEININFEYLDKSDGFILQILHTGTCSENFVINGTIKSFGKIFKGKYNKYYKKFSIFDIIQDFFVFVTSITFSSYAIISKISTSITIIMIIFIVVFVPLFFTKLFFYYSRVPFKFKYFFDTF
jgi:hypothetical protein